MALGGGREAIGYMKGKEREKELDEDWGVARLDNTTITTDTASASTPSTTTTSTKALSKLKPKPKPRAATRGKKIDDVSIVAATVKPKPKAQGPKQGRVRM